MLNINKKNICIAPLLNRINIYNIFLYNLLMSNVKIYIGMIHISSFLKRYKFYCNFFEKIICNNIAIQFVGNNYKDLYKCIRLINIFKFSEINFNLGCPSLCAKKCNFGFYLMKDLKLIIKCLNSIYDANTCNSLVSIKHRLFLFNRNYNDIYNYMLDFLGNIFLYTKCKKFIIHARGVLKNNYSTNLNLKLSCNYDIVYNLKNNLPFLNIILNGDIKNILDIESHLSNNIDGVMIGRGVYYNPLFLVHINEYIKYKIIYKNNNDLFFKRNRISKYMLLIFYKLYNFIYNEYYINKTNPIVIIKNIYYIFNNINNGSIFKKRIISSCYIFKYFNNYLDFINFIFKDFI